MYTGRYYSLSDVASWTRRETGVFVLISGALTALHALAGWTWLIVPWPAVAVIGTAVAFITGFKNNASYGRLWEARQVWGGIVNASRAFGILVLDFIPDQSARTRILYRHFAWLTALRYQLREPRTWESMHKPSNVEYRRKYRVPEWEGTIQSELAALLDEAECSYILGRKNRAAQLLELQSEDLRRCAETSLPGEMKHLEVQRLLTAFADTQGKCERIKNFPYPRQYATLNLLFVWVFIALVPLSVISEFQKLGAFYVWLTVPVSVIISWVFHTMEKIGESSENPFEGSANDVPITALSRTIEIDLREMLREEKLPPPISPMNNVLM
jgi:putative membrane protein